MSERTHTWGAASAAGTDRYPNPGTVDTTKPNELVFAAFSVTGSRNVVNSSWHNGTEDFTERNDFSTNPPGTTRDATYASGDNLVNAPGTRNVTINMGQAAPWRGQVIRFQHDVTPPSAVSDLEVEYTAAESINLAWTAPGDDGAVGSASLYDLRLSLSEILTDLDFENALKIDAEPPPGMAGERQTMNVSGLRPNTTYFFALKAFDQIGNASPVSNVVRAMTPSKGGGSGVIVPVEIELGTRPELCTPERDIEVVVHAHNAYQVRISERPDLSDAAWRPYGGDVLRAEAKPFTLSPGDGIKEIFVQFMSPSNRVSAIEEVGVRLDEKEGCASVHAHETIKTPHGDKIIAPGVDFQCLSDFAHATVEPYLVNLEGENRDVVEYARKEQLSPVEVAYIFDHENQWTQDDIIVHVNRVGHLAYIHIEATSGLQHQIRGLVKADTKVIDDRILWSDSHKFSLIGPIEFDAYRELCAPEQVPHPHAGDIVRGRTTDGVYYVDAQRIRHVFESRDAFESWDLAARTETVPDYQIAKLPLGAPIGYKPGSLVRLYGREHPYLVDVGRRLRLILSSAAVDIPLMGALSMLDDAFLGSYTLEVPVNTWREVVERQAAGALTRINEVLERISPQ